jgi:NAD(P)-dependent dehydrogenase (short-subunit alcohol dehydrogenase family)
MADHSIPIVVDRSSLKSLAGKTVLITGASSGIGLETAELFYELGCNVVFVGGRKRPTTYVDLSSPRVLVLQCNVANWESQVDIFEATIAKFGKIDIVVPNAGVAEPMGQYFNLKVGKNGRPESLDMIAFDVDMKGTASTIALAFHYMMKTGGGSVVIMSSRAGYGGVPELPSYSAAKHGATGLLRSLEPPAGERNLAISLVAPGICFTPGTFPTEYVRGEEAFQAFRKKLKLIGLDLSSSLTCALATAYLAVGGMKTNGMGLLVDDDAIYNLEQAMLDSKPAWLTEIDVKKDKSREEYARQQEKIEKEVGPPTSAKL